ncbi:hypothetical protein D3C84_1269240 [compost metagenome]
MTLADASDSHACTSKVSILSSGLTINMELGLRGVAMMLGSRLRSRLSYGDAGSVSGGLGVTLNIVKLLAS